MHPDKADVNVNDVGDADACLSPRASGQSDFPSPVGDLSFPYGAFPIVTWLKR